MTENTIDRPEWGDRLEERIDREAEIRRDAARNLAASLAQGLAYRDAQIARLRLELSATATGLAVLAIVVLAPIVADLIGG